jgi:5-(carboxyamino)imidazole ribonucleotide mutase
MTPLVGIIMGSSSDLETMRDAAKTLDELAVPYEMKVVSAHRTPDLMFSYAQDARARGIRVIIAGAGGAAHLPGMTASKTVLPVIGVPIQSRALNGMDSLLSIAQMPAGIPVATVAIGNATNAALLAARILALNDPELETRLIARSDEIARAVEATKIDEGKAR